MRAPNAAGPPPRAVHRLTAFGLEVRCDWPLTGTEDESSGAAGAGHPAGAAAGPRPITVVQRRPSSELDASWTEPAERVFAPEFPDGRTRFTVERTDRHYRLWLEDYGRYLIDRHGSWIACERDGTDRAVQERFIFAQALPVAAVLQGYEVLHASAVCGPQGVAAFVGASGAGKTSLATRVVLRGAALVTDDVLAVELRSPVLAHPGPPFMALRHDDAALLGSAAGRLGRPVGASDKLHIARSTPPGPLPLRSVYHLRRGPTTAIRALGPEVRHLVLGHAFVPYVMTPERMVGHLRLAELVSAEVQQWELQTPEAGLTDATVQTVAAHLREHGVG